MLKTCINPCSKFGAITLLIFVYVMEYALSRIPEIYATPMNMQEKLLRTFWPLLIIYGLKWVTPKQAGLNSPTSNKDYLMALVIGVLWIIFALLTDFSKILDITTRFSANNLAIYSSLFLLIMPALSEELLFRGVYLAILNKAFSKQWSFLNIKFGFGAILVTLLFIQVHVIHFFVNGQIIVIDTNFWNWLDYLVEGSALVLIREKTKSLWPAMILHSLLDGGVITAMYLYLIMINS